MGLRDFQLILKGANGVGRLAEIVGANVDKVYWELNGFGGADIKMSPLHSKAPSILINKTEIEVWINESLEHSVVPRSVKGGLDLAIFSCEGIMSYLDSTYITDADVAYTALDQLTIGWNLVNLSQTISDRNIDSAFFSDSGVSRSVAYSAEEMPNIWDKLVELTRLNDGFDFEIVLFGDGRREWTPYYPNKGSFKPEFALELDRYGRRFIKDLTYSEDGLSQVTEAFISGGTVDDTSTDPPTKIKMVGHHADLTGGYGAIQKVVSNSQSVDQAYLDDQATALVNQNKLPAKLPDLRVDGNLFGLIKVGDVLPVRIDYGCYQVNGNYRINYLGLSSQYDDMDLRLQP